jgi:hypothetical protein
VTTVSTLSGDRRRDVVARLEAEIAKRLQHDEPAEAVARDFGLSVPFVAAVGELLLPIED